MTTTWLREPDEEASAIPPRKQLPGAGPLAAPTLPSPASGGREIRPSAAVYLTIALREPRPGAPKTPPPSVPRAASPGPAPGRRRHGHPTPRPRRQLRAILRRTQPRRAQNRRGNSPSVHFGWRGADRDQYLRRQPDQAR